MRLAMDHKIPRNEFLKFYVGNEINPNLKKFLDTNLTWKQFFSKNKDKVDQYKAGKEKLFGFFVGQVMKLSGGKANPQ